MRLESTLPAVALLATLATSAGAQVQTFQVVNSGATAYLVDGNSDPVLTLERGRSYRFQVSAIGHPLWIKTTQVTGTGSAYSNGVTNNGEDQGDVLFDVPMDAPATLFYICQFHFGMGNRIDVVNPTGVDPGFPGVALRIVPNPARGSVRFVLDGAEAARTVEVFDARGRLLQRFEFARGSIAWEGRDLRGATLPSGVYLVRARGASGRTETRRLLWLGR